MIIINGRQVFSFIDPNDTTFHNAAYGTSMPLPTITSPAADATGVSTTPTIVTAEGVSRLFSLYTRDSTNQTGVGTDTDLIYNFASGPDIPLNTATGVFTLPAGFEFELMASPALTAFSLNDGAAFFDWVFASDNSLLPNAQTGSNISQTWSSSNEGLQPIALAFIRTTVAIDIKVRVTSANGTSTLDTNRAWAKIQATTSKFIDYTFTAIQVQVRVKATGAMVFDSGEVANLQVTVSPALSAATQYETRTRHKNEEESFTRWSAWQTFTTA